VEGVDRSKACGTVVGSARIHEPSLLVGRTARRRDPHPHARPGWHGLSDDGRLSGGCRARADRLHQSRAGCGWQPHVEVLTTVTFAEQGGKTKQILHARVIKMTAQAAPYLKGMEAGWTQSLERLAESLAKT